MTDVFTRSKRRQIMTRIRSKDTRPEIAVRTALRGLRVRYSSSRMDLPGKPDIVLTDRRAAVFVHGCFWHQHPRCPRCSMPSSNTAYWRNKLSRNVERFREVRRSLKSKGWDVFVVWECQTKNSDRLRRRLTDRFETSQLSARSVT